MKTDFQKIRELRPYLGDPPAMAAGGAGKQGYLYLGFECNNEGKTLLRHWERRAPMIVQQALYFDERLPSMACVYMLSAGGPQVDGDRYRCEVHAGAQSEVHLSTGAAIKVATMHYNFASSEQHFRLDDGAYMEYLPEPVIPARGARLWSQTELTIAPSATLFYGECYLSGRHHHLEERFQYDLLSLNLRAQRPSGEELFCEKILLEPARHTPTGLGVMGRYELFATALILTPPPQREAILKRVRELIGFRSEWALGILRLPSDAGLVCRILSRQSDEAKRLLRTLCSATREVVKGVPMPEEFPWR